jgi:hypothetical protein
MLNLNKSINKILPYKFIAENDFSLKLISYGILSVPFLLLFRIEFPEIKLLQLLPGLYLFLLFCGCSFLVFFSDIFTNYNYKNELKLDYGFKTLKFFYLILTLKLFLSLFFIGSFLCKVIVVPISLESLINSSSYSLESLWSFTQIIIVEILLGLVLLFFFELPFFITFFLTTEEFVFLLIKNYKLLLIFIILISGMLTPTIDIETQLLIGFNCLFIYILVIFLLKKSTRIKFEIFSSLVF